jgi:hypothetical protein
MTGYSTDKISHEAYKSDDSFEKNELEEIRNLLFEPELTKIKNVQERLDNFQLNTDNLSQLLPGAIAQRSLPDNQLTEVLLPTIEDAIHISVRKDVDVIANAIFPVLLPGIQKAVAAAISEMTQSLNQTLEHGLSPKSFKWRLEAKLTGKSFAEVVMLHTLLYQVEQVFLIHKESGLVLQHLVAPEVSAEDADMVSAMLTAIRNFVQDSFNVDQGESLDALRFGGLALWIEQGSEAILAGVIRGNAPKELRLVFQNSLIQIHQKYHHKFDAFEGDTNLFLDSQTELRACLQAQYESEPETASKSSKPLPILGIILATITLGIATCEGLIIRDNLRWSAFLDKLNSEQGIVITKTEKHWDKYFIFGLRDPLAVDPNKLMKSAKLNPKKVVSQWKPYISLEPALLTARVEKMLKPPKTVSLKIDENGILHAKGFASVQWITETRRRVEFIPGINQFQEKELIGLGSKASK